MLERFKVPEADRVYVSADEMRSATEAIFRALDLSDEDAVQCADVLMTNDLRGVESHGVSNMLRSYVAGYRAGRLNPRPEFTVEQETETTATIDGGRGLGLHVAPKAMAMAIEKARERGMGAVGVHGVGHMGGAGYHAMLALEHDMIGVAMSSSGALSMVPTFGAEPRLGTNPLAWAVPAGRMAPFVFDIGTTQVAQNKMRLARRVGAKIAPGWISDEHGTPVMEETDLPEKYFLLPLGSTRELGSHKGYGLATVVDILCSVLVGLGPGFTALEPGFHLMALRIDAFTDLDQFKTHMDELLEGLANTPPAPGHERVLYAGQLEAEDTELRLAEGIPYHTEVIEWFREIEAELGLDFSFT
ncbi:MAG: Ldh family oxidoreductase [Dehalococcoidia bacterium]